MHTSRPQPASRLARRLVWLALASLVLTLGLLRDWSGPNPEATPLRAEQLPRRVSSPFAPASTREKPRPPTLIAPSVQVSASSRAVSVALLEPTERMKLNPTVAAEELSYDYTAIAEDFLHFVKVVPNGGGGFRIESVAPDSTYGQLGLRRGDVIYSVDPPPGSGPDITFLRAEIKMQVYRDGLPLLLSHRPDQEPAPDARR